MVNYGLMIGMLMAVGLLFWVATRHWYHALKQLQSKYNELSRLEITEREARASEHVARRREQLSRLQAEKALQVKRRFLSCVSHEMRTPLNAIAGFAEVLTTHCDELEPDEKADLSRRIQESTKLLVGIVDKMIELSHYDSLQEIPRQDHTLVNFLCNEVLDSYRQKVAEGVELRYISDIDDGYIAQTNEECLRRLLCHLLDNAVKFTSEGSIVLVVSGRGEKGMLTFSVSDTGPGIPKERQKEVFELFPETGEEVKTTGMGLSICRSIVRLLGGMVYIDPHYEKGTRVVFSIKE